MNDDNLLRYKKFKYITFDTETENLNPVFNRPWQIGWAVTENGRITERHQYHLKIPKLNVSPDAARITHFNLDEHNRKARDPREIYEIFAPYYYGDFFKVAQNAYFDVNLIKSWERLIGADDTRYVNHNLYDTVALSKAYKLGINPPEDKSEYINWQFKMLNFKQKGLKTSLGLMCREFDIEFNDAEAHAAIYDCVKTSELFQKLIWAVRVY